MNLSFTQVVSMIALSLPLASCRAQGPLEAFDQATRTVTERFFDRSFAGQDWKASVAKARAELAPTSTPRDVTRVTNKLLATLRASHTGFYSKGDQTYWALKGVFSGSISEARTCNIGVWFVTLGDKVFARNILGPSPLHAGDEIATPGFEPVLSFIEADGTCKRSVTLSVRSVAGGPARDVVVAPRLSSFAEEFLQATEASVRTERVGTKRIGYVHLWTGTHEKFKQALRAAVLKLAPEIDALVLDLRDGFGGSSPEYIDPLFMGREGGEFKKPMAVLINDGVRSGKEWLAYLFKKTQRATLIGTTTSGSFLGGAPFEIGSDYLLYLAVMRFSPPGVDAVIEGVGVSPDVVIPFTLPYSQGRDPQLEAAFDMI